MPTEVNAATLMADSGQALDQVWPVLIETTQPDSTSKIILAGIELSLGQSGSGSSIEIDDPLLAAHHATIRRQSNGEWWIEAKPSKNGLWVQIASIRLSESCRFQCGEQRFLFVV